MLRWAIIGRNKRRLISSTSHRIFVTCKYLCAWGVLLLTCVGASAQSDEFIRLKDGPPPGFEDLTAAQTTQADLYFGGEFLSHVFVEFDPYTIEVQDLAEALTLIPNLRDPDYIAQYLSGPQPTGSEHLCTRAKRQDCGELQPAVAGIIFDEGRYRLDLFLHPDQLLVHRVAGEKYLPESTAELANLHNIRMNATGSGSRDYFNLASESYVSYRQQRLRARYGWSDQGPSLYELAWQRDTKNMEYEFGSLRSIGGNLAFGGDVDLLGLRVATSTKTRLDLEQALGSPILLFLPTRSRVDVLRGNELLDSRFYAAGNAQLDTTDLPDGAYNITLRIEDLDGGVRTEEHFFVRSGQMPPQGEPQYYLEAGKILASDGYGIPRFAKGGWFRAGASLRMRDHLAWDSEVHHANGQTALSSGVMVLNPTWHLYAGGLLGVDGEIGTMFRGALTHEQMRVSFDLRHMHEGGASFEFDEYSLSGGGYTQGSATLAFPVGQGQMFLRGRVNHRASQRTHTLGFSYMGSVFRKQGLTADLVLDGGVGDDDRWVRLGVNLRWYHGSGSSSLSPRLQYVSGDQPDSGLQPEMYGIWHTPADIPGLGYVDQTVMLEHGAQRSAIGARFLPHEFAQADIEVGLQRERNGRGSSGLYYAVNHQFSVVNTKGHTTIGDGGSNAGAVIVHVTGNTQGKFAVLVGNRVVGHVSAGAPNIISLRPYETYQIRIKPVGNAIVGYEQTPIPVTLYPGNVQTVTFDARKIVVVIAQALSPDGTPLARGRLTNVEGYGATDPTGWFQVEVAHSDPLLVQRSDGGMCRLDTGDYEAQDGVIVLDPIVCEPIRAPL